MTRYSNNSISVDVLRWLEESSDIFLPVQARSRKSLRRIVDCAIDLFLTNGYANTTIDDIALASETSTGAIYARFRDKNAILVALISAYYRDRFKVFEDFFEISVVEKKYDSRAILKDYVKLLIGYFRSDESMICLIESVRQNNQRVAELTSRLNINVAERLNNALVRAMPKPDIDFKYRVIFFHATFRNAMAMTVLHQKSPLGAQLDIHSAEFESESIRFALSYFYPADNYELKFHD